MSSSPTTFPVIFSPQKYTIFIDGSMRNKRCGWGVFWGYKHPYNINDSITGSNATCARGEVMALYQVLLQIHNAIKISPILKDNSSFDIKSDNEYVVNAYNQWLSGWISRGWTKSDGQKVSHEDLWSVIYQIKQMYGNIIHLEHVSAHIGIYGNEMADLMAKGETDKLVPETLFHPQKHNVIRVQSPQGIPFIKDLQCKSEQVPKNTNLSIDSKIRELLKYLNSQGYHNSIVKEISHGIQVKNPSIAGSIIFYNNGNVYPQGSFWQSLVSH